MWQGNGEHLAAHYTPRQRAEGLRFGHQCACAAPARYWREDLLERRGLDEQRTAGGHRVGAVFLTKPMRTH